LDSPFIKNRDVKKMTWSTESGKFLINSVLVDFVSIKTKVRRIFSAIRNALVWF